MSTWVWAVIAVIVLAGIPLHKATLAEPPARAEVARQAKPATALVLVAMRGQGTAFCVHPSGLFVTNHHVVQGLVEDGAATLVLDSGSNNQRTVKAKVVRLDKTLDLALLQAQSTDKFPALPLGSDERLAELEELIAFGFPFGTALAQKGEYPNITVNAVNVSSLRTDAQRELHRIQIDSTLNPGNSGGPVVDRSGKVVGVVVSGIVGAGINMAIPVRHVRKFLQRPVIVLQAPTITPANKHQPAEFRVSASTLDPEAAPLDVELVLRGPGNTERNLPMKRSGTVFQASAVPFASVGDGWNIRLEVKYSDGSVCGMAKDQPVRIGAQTVKLAEVVALSCGSGGGAELVGGRKYSGPVALETLPVRVGDQVLNLKLAQAQEIRSAADPLDNCLRCVVIARAGGREVGRLEENVYLEGTQRATLENLREGRFVKPLPAGSPTTYLKAVSTAGDYIGQGQKMSYEDKEITVRGNHGSVSISVGGWNIEFAAPRGGSLGVGDYPNAKRFPFHDESPGLSFTGHGRGSNRVGGRFVIWELEIANNIVKKLAVDFIHRSEGTGPPLYGMLRFNSSME